MNEKIRDLFEDAGGYYADFEDDGNFQFVLPDLEKFAELIIQECLNCARSYNDQNEDYADGIDSVRDEIKSLFGIK